MYKFELPYGYIINANGNLDIHPVGIEKVKLIFKLCTAGLNSEEIAKLLS